MRPSFRPTSPTHRALLHAAHRSLMWMRCMTPALALVACFVISVLHDFENVNCTHCTVSLKGLQGEVARSAHHPLRPASEAKRHPVISSVKGVRSTSPHGPTGSRPPRRPSPTAWSRSSLRGRDSRALRRGSKGGEDTHTHTHAHTHTHTHTQHNTHCTRPLECAGNHGPSIPPRKRMPRNSRRVRCRSRRWSPPCAAAPPRRNSGAHMRKRCPQRPP